MCPPSSKFITWVFELLIFKLWTLLTTVYKIINSTFSISLCSMISGFDLYSNELINMHLGLILWQSCMDLSNLGLGPLLCRTLLRMRYVFTFKFKYRAVHHWYATTWSCESHCFSSRISSLRCCKIIFSSGLKLSLFKDPAPSSTGTMASYL